MRLKNFFQKFLGGAWGGAPEEVHKSGRSPVKKEDEPIPRADQHHPRWIGTFASKALVLLLMPLYTACLLPGQFNTAELISQTANLLIPLACLGITDGLFRFALDSRADKPTVLKTGVGVLAAASAGFLLLSPLLLLIDYFIGYVWLIVLYVLAANFHAASAVCQSVRPPELCGAGILTQRWLSAST